MISPGPEAHQMGEELKDKYACEACKGSGTFLGRELPEFCAQCDGTGYDSDKLENLRPSAQVINLDRTLAQALCTVFNVRAQTHAFASVLETHVGMYVVISATNAPSDNDPSIPLGVFKDLLGMAI